MAAFRLGIRAHRRHMARSAGPRNHVLQHYVRLAAERDLGNRRGWLEFIAGNPSLEPES